jgi:O-antigen biosynthesis protein
MIKRQYPRISCIMPTADRGAFIPQSVSYFLNQTYPNKELIIVDDGNHPVKNIIPRHPDIRYYFHPGKKTIGEKRNLACQEATGKFIQHWDDDDWIASAWLSSQYEKMMEHNADVSGMKNLRFFDPVDKKAWLFRFSNPRKPWVCGATLFYTKSLWERNAFPHISQGEDDRFIWSAVRKNVISHDQIHLYAARIHSKNTIDRNRRLRLLQPIEYQIIEDMIGKATLAKLQQK